MHDEWRSGLKQDHLLRVLQCTRLLSRDKALRQRFVSLGAVEVRHTCFHVLLASFTSSDLDSLQVLGTIFKNEATAHFSGSVTQFQVRFDGETKSEQCSYNGHTSHDMFQCLNRQVETLTEIASIIKRLTSDEAGLTALVKSNVHQTLTLLLSSSGKLFKGTSAKIMRTSVPVKRYLVGHLSKLITLTLSIPRSIGTAAGACGRNRVCCSQTTFSTRGRRG